VRQNLSKLLSIAICYSIFSAGSYARPYAGVSGIAAAADSAATAGNNPAGASRFSEPATKVELTVLQSESEWEGSLGEGPSTTSSDSTTFLPSGSIIRPINDEFTFAFTVLGFGYSDDFGDWPGQYFIESYDSLSISAYPSIAYRVNDQWSVAASLALTYASFTQERAVSNILDPGFEDGSSELDTDGLDVGFGLSTLYEFSDRTRLGLVYNSEIDPTQEGKAKFRGLGPNTENALAQSGFLGADVEVKSTTPQSIVAGLYHEFPNDHALVFDAAWLDVSNFELSEYYFDGNQLAANEAQWQDVWAMSGSYSWPVSDRWMLSAGAMYVSSMVEDEDRTFMLRMDEIWGLGFAAEWQWTDKRRIDLNLSYLTIGDAPTKSPELPGLGSVSGEYSQRDIFILRLALNWGAL